MTTTIRIVLPLALLLLLPACAKRPTAMEACKKLEATGAAASCREDKPGGLGAAAVEKAVFDLPGAAGKTGQVLRFDKDDAYAATEASFTGAALLAGPHRYGSKKALIFVQANESASLEDGKKLKAAVDAL